MPIFAVPELAIAAAAAMALVLLFGLHLIASVLSGPFRLIPFVGGGIANGIEGLLRAAMNAASGAFNAVLGGASDLFGIFRSVFGLLHAEFANTISDVLGYAHRIQIWLDSRVIPWVQNLVTGAYHWADHLYNAAVRFAQNGITGAYHWADHLYNVAIAWAQTAVTGAYHWADHLYNVVTAWAQTAVTGAYHWADHLYNAAVTWAAAEMAALEARVRAYALSLFDTVRIEMLLAVQQAETLAAQEAAAAERGAIAAVSAAATTGLAVPWQGIITDVDALRGIIADTWPDIRDAVDAIPRAIPADLAGVISALGVLAIPMLRAMEDCVLPNCRNLSGLGQVISALRDGAAAAALIAWLAYCITDPVAAADDTEAVGGPIAQVTLGGLEALFRIQA